MDYKRSSVVTTDDDKSTTTCTMYRDFETPWTDIPFKAGTAMNYHAGYNVFTTKNSLNTFVSGHAKELQITVLE